MDSFDKHSTDIASGALLITLLPLVPFPLVDFFLEPIIVKRTLTPLFLEPKFVKFFTGRGNFCLGCLWGILMYPLLKLIKVIRFFVQFKRFIQTFFYWFYKGYIIHKAHQEFPSEWLKSSSHMIIFGRDLDIWLRSSQCTSLINQQTLNTFGGLAQMKQLLDSWGQDKSESIANLLQHQGILDEWLTSWKNQHDTPQ